MTDRLFVKKPFQPPAMELALVFSTFLFLSSFSIAWWAIGPLDAAYFLLTEYGWTVDANDKVIHPTAQKFSLVLRYLTVFPPLISLFWGIVVRSLKKLQSSQILSDHTVVCGLGWQGRAFIKSLHSRGEKVVVIELAADEPAEYFCAKKDASLIYGNAEDKEVLKSAGVLRAKEVFICTGSQDQNLSIAQCIGEAMKEATDRKEPLHGIEKSIDWKEPLRVIKKAVNWIKPPQVINTVIDRKNPLQVQVSLGELPIDDMDSDQLFFPLLPSSEHCHFVLYDPDRRMARCFFYRHKVYQWADEWYANRRWLAPQNESTPQDNNYRVHIVFLGYTRLVGELILQYARIWPSVNQLPPIFTVICENSGKANVFLVRNPCLKPSDGHDDASQMNPGSLFILPRSEDEPILDEKLMTEIEQQAPVTAVICSSENSRASLQQASYCKMLARRLGMWQVPVFAEIEEQQGTEGLLEIGESQPFAGDRIIPFGSSLHYCDTALLSYSDGLAKAIHESFYAADQKRAEDDNTGGPAVRNWSMLEQRYQRSNYRAADAAMLKLYSAGYRWNTVIPQAHILEFKDDQDALSIAEHQSWVNEKLLDQWSFGERDEQLKQHPCIIPWEELEEADQKKDKDIVSTLRVQFESDKPTAGRPLTIGFIGHTNITEPQVKFCQQQLEKKLKNIEKLQNTDARYWVELVSPLAPGSDIVLIKEVVKLLMSKSWSIAGFRLLIPHAVPWDKVDDDFRSHWEQGNQWLYPQEQYKNKNSHSDWADFKKAIQKERSTLFTTMREAGYPVDVVDLRSNGDTPLSNHEGYIRAAQWIVEKSEVLVAVLDDSRTSTATDEWTDGGTGHSVAQWQSIDKGMLLEINPTS